MKTYIHGTSYESTMDILKNGLKVDNKDMIWECSNSDLLYLRDKNDEEDDSLMLCIESGQIAAAKLNSLSTKIGIIEIELSDKIAEESVLEDTSCENMYGCFEMDIDELNKYIESGEAVVTIHIYENAYLPYLRPFYLTGNNQSYMKIKDPLLKQAIDVINSATKDIYYEDLFDYGDVIETYQLKTIKEKCIYE